jgi:hypothetical protein
MDRRDFLSATMIGLISCGWGCGRSRAASIQGCRAAAGSESSEWKILTSTGDTSIDKFFYHFGNVMSKDFGIHPGLGFYSDGRNLNALALPKAFLPVSIDGSILMGASLYTREVSGTYGKITLPDGQIHPYMFREALNCNIILAHEFGHIMQYKAGMSPDGPWQMELHADYMAGWWLRRRLRLVEGTRLITGDDSKPPKGSSIAPASMVKEAAKRMFELGDTAFNDPAHHGEPEFRSTMLRAGYEEGSVTAKNAFEKGRRLVGLA